MDQGFNDDELADIMNEIESLEQEFTEETQPEQLEAKAEVEEVAEAKTEEVNEEQPEEVVEAKVEDAPQSEPEQVQTEIVEKLSAKSDSDIEQAHHEAHDDQNVHAIKPEQKGSQDSKEWGSTSMDFSVEGNMKMNMFFKVSGKTVHLHVNEGAFEIELEGGMKFSIPVHEQSDKKAA